jgi:hypothetical protein
MPPERRLKLLSYTMIHDEGWVARSPMGHARP